MAAEQKDKMEQAIEFNKTAASLERGAQAGCMSVLGQLISADSTTKSEASTLRTRDEEKVLREERKLEVEKVERDHPNGFHQGFHWNNGSCPEQAFTSFQTLCRIAEGELGEKSKSTLCLTHRNMMNEDPFAIAKRNKREAPNEEDQALAMKHKEKRMASENAASIQAPPRSFPTAT